MNQTAEFSPATTVDVPFPSDWQSDELLTFLELQRGVDLPVQDRRGGEVPIFGSNGLLGLHDTSVSDGPGVITGRSGTIGKVFYTESKYWPLNTALYVKNFKGNLPKFVYYKLGAIGLERFSTGTGVPTLNRNVAHKEMVAFPPLPEQKKIAAILTAVDDKLDVIARQIEATQTLKQGLMQTLFSRGVGTHDADGRWVPHTEFKDSELGKIPAGWSTGELLSFLELQRGFDLPVQDRRAGEVPIFGSNGLLGFHDTSICNGPGVITGRSGTIGKVFYSEGPYWPLNTSLYVKDFKGNLPKFIYYKLGAFGLERFSTGTGVPTLNRNVAHNEMVAFPPLPEQQKIAAILKAVDDKLDVISRQFEATQTLKRGLMQKLLTGEWRVSVDASATGA